MKKILITSILMLTFIFSCALISHAAQYDTIKVGLYYGSSAPESITVSAPDVVSYGYHDGNTHQEVGVLQGASLTFRAISSTQIIINEVQIYETGGNNISLLPKSGYISVNGTQYRGGIILTHASPTTMTVINILTMEEYLYGVVPGEVPSSWNPEALKAQAVCARGYAVSNYNKHSSYGFNVCSTTNCQVYKGVSAERPSTTKAVDDTRGQVVMYGDKIIESLFYSSSGGHTANAKNVWSSDIPYLRGVPDPYEAADSPNHSWSATLSASEVQTALAAAGVDVGSITGLSTVNDETGRVLELVITGTSGTHTLYKGSSFSPFVSHGVISQKFTVTPVGGQSEAIYGVSQGVTSVLQKTYAMSSGGKVSSPAGNIYMQGSAGTRKYSALSNASYVFNGGGWGHGVGLSQYGAKGMADNGYSYNNILLHYYPGTWIGYVYY